MVSAFFDIEMIDINENVENFKFERVPKSCLDKIISSYKDNKPFLEFTSSQGNILLERKYMRGIMYAAHIEKHKTVTEETLESAEEVGKIQIVKKSNKPKVVVKGK